MRKYPYWGSIIESVVDGSMGDGTLVIHIHKIEEKTSSDSLYSTGVNALNNMICMLSTPHVALGS